MNDRYNVMKIHVFDTLKNGREKRVERKIQNLRNKLWSQELKDYKNKLDEIERDRIEQVKLKWQLDFRQWQKDEQYRQWYFLKAAKDATCGIITNNDLDDIDIDIDHKSYCVHHKNRCVNQKDDSDKNKQIKIKWQQDFQEWQKNEQYRQYYFLKAANEAALELKLKKDHSSRQLIKNEKIECTKMS